MSSKVSASVTNARPRLSVVLVDAVVDQQSIQPVASTTIQKPSTSTTHIDPVVSVSAVVPAADISYINLVFSVDLNVSGLFSCKIDSVHMDDGKIFSFSKAISESFVMIDGKAYTLEKMLTESFNLSDQLEALLIFIRNFNESQTVADSYLINVEKNLTESIVAIESIVFGISKSLSDGFALNDSAEATDGLMIAYSSTFANVVFVADTYINLFQKAKSESVLFADSGFLLQQDYIDLTYFAEDYVGVGYTF